MGGRKNWINRKNPVLYNNITKLLQIIRYIEKKSTIWYNKNIVY